MSIHTFPLVSLWPPWPHPGHPGNGRYPRAGTLATRHTRAHSPATSAQPSPPSAPPSAPVSTIAQIHTFCALRTESDPLSPTPQPPPRSPHVWLVHVLTLVRLLMRLSQIDLENWISVAEGRGAPSTPCFYRARSLCSSPPPSSARPRRRAAGTSKSWRRRRKRPSPGGGTTTCGGACSLGSAQTTSPTLSCFPRTTSTRPRGTTYVFCGAPQGRVYMCSGCMYVCTCIVRCGDNKTVATSIRLDNNPW